MSSRTIGIKTGRLSAAIALSAIFATAVNIALDYQTVRSQSVILANTMFSALGRSPDQSEQCAINGTAHVNARFAVARTYIYPAKSYLTALAGNPSTYFQRAAQKMGTARKIEGTLMMIAENRVLQECGVDRPGNSRMTI